LRGAAKLFILGATMSSKHQAIALLRSSALLAGLLLRVRAR
jgi:hypothetical protein